MRTISEKQFALASLISLGTSSGTGFIYKSDNGAYLITAKHVLYDESQNLRVKEIEVVSQTTEVHDDSVFRFRIDLNKAIVKYHKKNDVALVQIAVAKDSTNTEIKALNYVSAVERLIKGNSKGINITRESILLLDDVLISNDVYVSGYPTSLGLESSIQFDSTKPLLRKGIVANVNKQARTIILDCPVYGGNSGGPVIQVTQIDGEKSHKIIGVISQYIPFVQRWKNERDRIIHLEYLNSGYSVATSLDAVLELIDEIESTK